MLADGADALAPLIGGASTLVVLAGVTPAPGADYAPNVALALAGLEAARRSGVARVCLASSAAVYGRSEEGAPLNERAALAPVTAYGQAKAEMEQASLRWRDRAGPDAPGMTLMRIGNVVGTDLFFRNAAQATTAAPLLLDRFADGTGPVRSYIGPGTFARVLMRLAEAQAPLPDVLNIGPPGGGVDMAEFVQALAQAGRPVPCQRRAAPADALAALRLDTTLLQGLCRFAPDSCDPAAMVAEWLDLRAGLA